LSLNTIRKFLQSSEVDPKSKLPDRPSKLDAFADKLSSWVKLEASKSRKQNRTTRQVPTDLLGLGYDGSYGRLAAFVRVWKTAR
jgi:hypothetical protein